MVETLLAALAGGGTGLLGSLFGRVAGYFEEKQKIAKLQIELDHELKLQEMQQIENQKERENEQAIAGMEAQTATLVASYEHDSTYSDSALRWVRPVLTLCLIIGSVWVYSTIPDEVTKSDIAKQIVYFTGVAIAWWFADRSGKGKR